MRYPPGARAAAGLDRPHLGRLRSAARMGGPMGRPCPPWPGDRRPRHRRGDRYLQRRRGAERDLDRDRRQPDGDERRLHSDRARADRARGDDGAAGHDGTEPDDHSETARQPGGDRLAARPARVDDRAPFAPSVERARARQTPRRLSCEATASVASGSSTPTATRAFIPATTSSSPASSTLRRRPRVRSSERGPSATARRTSARSSRSPAGVGMRRAGQTRSERLDRHRSRWRRRQLL